MVDTFRPLELADAAFACEDEALPVDLGGPVRPAHRPRQWRERRLTSRRRHGVNAG